MTLGKHQYIYDPTRANQRRMVPQPREKWMQRPGRHQAIWTPEYHQEVVAELERRREFHIRNNFRFPFSGLLRYSADALHTEFGPDLELLEQHRELHTTPTGAEQAFTSCAFRSRRPDSPSHGGR